MSQLFHSPVIFFEGNRYVGGKAVNNKGGQYTDLIFKNDITDNIALIEIKSPVKPLLGKKYRQSFSISDELSGGINQLLKQRDTLYKDYTSLLYHSDIKFCANNIECILLIGNVGVLTPDQQATFDNFRNEMRSVRIIGFDELICQVNNLLKLFNDQTFE